MDIYIYIYKQTNIHTYIHTPTYTPLQSTTQCWGPALKTPLAEFVCIRDASVLKTSGTEERKSLR